MATLEQCETAEKAIKLNLINRLQAEGLVSRSRALRLRTADLDSVLDIVFLHCKRVLVPFGDGMLVMEPKGTVQ